MWQKQFHNMKHLSHENFWPQTICLEESIPTVCNQYGPVLLCDTQVESLTAKLEVKVFWVGVGGG